MLSILILQECMRRFWKYIGDKMLETIIIALGLIAVFFFGFGIGLVIALMLTEHKTKKIKKDRYGSYS